MASIFAFVSILPQTVQRFHSTELKNDRLYDELEIAIPGETGFLATMYFLVESNNDYAIVFARGSSVGLRNEKSFIPKYFATLKVFTIEVTRNTVSCFSLSTLLWPQADRPMRPCHATDYKESYTYLYIVSAVIDGTSLESCKHHEIQLFLSQGGIYIFELINLYGGSGICILWLAIFECIAISWVYGVDEFYDNVKFLLGYYPPAYFKYCLKYITTMFCFVSSHYFTTLYCASLVGSLRTAAGAGP